MAYATSPAVLSLFLDKYDSDLQWHSLKVLWDECEWGIRMWMPHLETETELHSVEPRQALQLKPSSPFSS